MTLVNILKKFMFYSPQNHIHLNRELVPRNGLHIYSATNTPWCMGSQDHSGKPLNKNMFLRELKVQIHVMNK